MLVHFGLSRVLGIAILLIKWWRFIHWNNIHSDHRNRCPFHLAGPQTILLESLDKAFGCHPCLEVRSYFSVFHNIRVIDTWQIREGKPFIRKRWESFCHFQNTLLRWMLIHASHLRSLAIIDWIPKLAIDMTLIFDYCTMYMHQWQYTISTMYMHPWQYTISTVRYLALAFYY